MAQSMWTKFAIRDGILIALALVVWSLLAGRSADGGAVGDFAGFVCGVLLTVGAYVLHEWGHVVAGAAVGSVMAPNPRLGSGFIFAFHPEKNSLGQFLTMSVGGFVVTGLVVWAFHVHLPDGLLATRVARGGSLFLAFLGVFLELPLVVAALYRRAVPAAVEVPPRRRNAAADPAAGA